MRAFLILIFFSFVFVVATIIGIPYFVSTGEIEARVIQAVKDRTGRTLSMGGETEFVLFPNAGFKAREVTLSNPRGMDSGSVITMRELRVSIKVLPLLTGDVDVDELIFEKPVITLVADGAGRTNWSFETGEGAAASGTAEAEDAGGPGGLLIKGVRLGNISLIDGRLDYRNLKTNATFKAEQINVSLGLESLNDPLQASGSAVWNGDRADFKMSLNSADAFMDGKLAGLTLKVESNLINASYDGTAALADGLILEGKINANSPSLRRLAEWTGNPVAPGKGLKNFKVDASLNFNGGAVTMSEAQIALDGMTAKGTAAVRTDGPRPAVTATLALDKLDLNQYVESGGGSDGGSGDNARASAGWSTAPISFLPLRAADADLDLTAGEVTFKELKFGRGRMTMAIRGGKLTAKLNEFAAYDGSATGTLVLDGSGKTPGIDVSAVLRDVNSLPLLERGVGFDWIEGKANLAFDLKTAGANQSRMISALSGKGRFQFADGAVRGINIAQMVRSLGTATLTGWDRGSAQKTDFSALTATFTVNRGIATNTDLAMASPLIRLSGKGTVDMPGQRLSYRISPKLVGTLKGQGGQTDLAGLDVPIIIKGPWAKPDIYPDIEGILQNPQAAYDKLKQVGKTIKAGGAKTLIKSILGGGSKGSGDAVPTTESENPARTLKNIEKELQKDPLKTFKKLF